MTDPTQGPLLFLDVDGTLLPYAGAQLPSTPEEWDRWQRPTNPQLAKVVREHGPLLSALPCEPMWATAWMHDANKVIAPLLGIRDLPVAPLPDAPEEDDPSVLHWKTRALVEFADGRAFVWVDDETGDLDRAWVAAHHDGPALLHRVDATTGLTAADLATIADWLLLHWSTP